MIEIEQRSSAPATSYLSPKVEIRHRPAVQGNGVFACQVIEPFELVCVFTGVVITGTEIMQLPIERRGKCLQIEEDLYLLSLRFDEPADQINHSCQPNVGFDGQIILRAMRRIEPGEEICYDYAMSDGSPYDEFDCFCGADGCRGCASGEDWRRVELQERYAGWFSPYLQRRIGSVGK